MTITAKNERAKRKLHPMKISLDEYKKEFSDRRGIHLNNAGMAPISKRVAEKIAELTTRNLFDGSFVDAEWVPEIRKTRETLAQFLGAKPESVSFFGNCAGALSTVAFGFSLNAQDTIVTIDQEYASNYYPWMMATRKTGARLEVIHSEKNGAIRLETILSAIKPGVKIVAASWVQFQTGTVLDLRAIGDACQKVGAYFVVDGIQGLGQLPFDFDALPVDVVVGGSHKWLCGLNGQAFMAMKDRVLSQVDPLFYGSSNFNRFGTFADRDASLEKSARKYEAGGIGYFPLFAMKAAVELAEAVSIEVIATEIARLSKILREGILSCPHLELATPLTQAGGITSFQLPIEQEVAFLKRCRDEKISIVKRGPYLRASVHAYSNDSEIDQMLEVLKGVSQ